MGRTYTFMNPWTRSSRQLGTVSFGFTFLLTVAGCKNNLSVNFANTKPSQLKSNSEFLISYEKSDDESGVATWNQINGVDHYKVIYAQDENCKTTLLTVTVKTSSSLKVDISQYASMSKVYFCVLAYDAKGNFIKSPKNNGLVLKDSAKSSSTSSSGVAPGSFSISAPSSTVTSPTPEISWSTSSSASYYNLKISTLSGCATSVQSYSNITSTTKVLSALTKGTYYVCVTAVNETGTSDASNSGSYNFSLDQSPLWSTPLADTYGIQNAALSINASATDADGDAITYAIDSSSTCTSATWSTALSINSSGMLTGTPGSQSNVTTCSVKINATSGSITANQTFNITLYPIAPAGFSCSGGGDLLTTCYVNSALSVAANALIAGPGTIELQSGGSISAPSAQKISIKLGGNFVIRSGGVLSANLSILQAQVITIDSGGSIDVSGLGYAANSGPGLGPENYGGSGGGHGGCGGNTGWAQWSNCGGVAYDSVSAPIDYGSGGRSQASFDTNDYVPGTGGGAVKLSATNVVLNGTISVNGGSSTGTVGSYGAGGGGAGSIWVIATSSISGTGSILGIGGTPTRRGGFGGGARVSFQANRSLFTGTVNLESGPPTSSIHNYAGMGSYGTFYTDIANPCTSGTLSSNCIISSLVLLGDQDITFNATSNITVTTGGEIRMTGYIGKLNIITPTLTIQNGGLIKGNLNLTASNLNVDATSSIDATARGYRGGWGNNAGAHPRGPSVGSQNYCGSGAGYGGVGGNCNSNGVAGGGTYGNKLQPVDFGSGGYGAFTWSGCSAGDGGGNVRLNISQTSIINGTVLANGSSSAGGCNYGAGGGSGGSVWLTTGSIDGTGSIRANGGGTLQGNGGAGGGGRIALEYSSGTFAGSISVTPGNGPASSTGGGVGTVCQNGTGC